MCHRPGEIRAGRIIFDETDYREIHEKRSIFTTSGIMITALVIVMIFFTGMSFAEQEKVKLTVGVRVDAPPFSYLKNTKERDTGEGPLGPYDGFSVEICKKIIEKARDPKTFNYHINVVEVTAQNRLPYLADGTIDILCGATTVTLERMRVADFSLFTFVSGVSVMYKDAPVFKKEGKDAVIKIGYLKSTTSEKVDKDIENKVKSELGYGDNVEIDCNNPRFDHYKGVQALIDGEFNAYLADREILLALQKHYSNHPELVVSRTYFTIEPYAIGLNNKKPELRYLANSVLSELFGDALSYKTDMPILDILKAHFPKSSFSKSLINLYRSQRLRRGSSID